MMLLKNYHLLCTPIIKVKICVCDEKEIIISGMQNFLDNDVKNMLFCFL